MSERPPELWRSLLEAREWVRRHRSTGVKCPCCGQFAKTYRRPMTASMAVALCCIDQYFRDKPTEEWLHVPSYLSSRTWSAVARSAVVRGGDWAKLVYWELIQPKSEAREDDSARSGLYKITPKGRDFVAQKLTVPRYVFIYNSVALGHEGPDISIKDALGTQFDYAALMGAE